MILVEVITIEGSSVSILCPFVLNSTDLLLQKLGRDPSDEDCFFDLLSKFQSSRMDDQRCHLDDPQNGDNREGAANALNEMIGWLRTHVRIRLLPFGKCDT